MLQQTHPSLLKLFLPDPNDGKIRCTIQNTRNTSPETVRFARTLEGFPMIVRRLFPWPSCPLPCISPTTAVAQNRALLPRIPKLKSNPGHNYNKPHGRNDMCVPVCTHASKFSMYGVKSLMDSLHRSTKVLLHLQSYLSNSNTITFPLSHKLLSFNI